MQNCSGCLRTNGYGVPKISLAKKHAGRNHVLVFYGALFGCLLRPAAEISLLLEASLVAPESQLSASASH